MTRSTRHAVTRDNQDAMTYSFLPRILAALAVLPVMTFAIACSRSAPPPAPVAEAGPSVPGGHVAIGELPDVDMTAVLAHTRKLSSDEFEGRLPGSKGEEPDRQLSRRSIQEGRLKPGNTDGTYVQKVPLVSITPEPATLVVNKGREEESAKWRDDFVAWTRHVAPTAGITDSELVFVGYGVVAPEFTWDDYKGLNVKGKTLVMLVNDPPVVDPAILPARPEGVRRQGDDVLRPLDLQVRDRRREGRGRCAADSRDRPGRAIPSRSCRTALPASGSTW